MSQPRGPTTLAPTTGVSAPHPSVLQNQFAAQQAQPDPTTKPGALVLTFESSHPHWTWRAEVSLVSFQATWSWWSSLPG